MKATEREYFEQCFAANFDAQAAANAALVASKVVCTGVLGKTLDEAFRALLLPDVEVKLTDIGTEFIRRIKALKEAGTLSEVAFVAAKNAITKAIGDCDPNILMFKKGVRRFCQNAGVATAGKHLFLITARNAIILHEPLSNLVQQGLEGRSREGLTLYNDFLREFQRLLNQEIVAAENALNAFDNGGAPPASDAVMQELSELGVDKKSHYIETPQHLFGCEVVRLRAFLDREMEERRRMVAMAAGTGWNDAQSTGKADHSVCNGVMSLATRYINQNKPNTPDTPNASEALKKAEESVNQLEQKEAERENREWKNRELNYGQKVGVLNPIIDAWEQKNAALFETTIQEIRACMDLIIASQRDLSRNDIITELVLVQSKKVRVMQAIVDESRPHTPAGWSANLDAKAWTECVSHLSDDLKIKFRAANIKKTNLAFQRVSSTVVNPAFGEGAEAESLRNGRLAQNGLSNTLISTLVLVWRAIHDRTKVLGAKGQLLVDSAENRPEIDRIIKEKEMNLVRAFWEYQTEYGYGKACGHGSYNKIVESLSLTDPDVRVGNDVDANFQRILETLDKKFIKELVLETAKGFDKQALSSAWESKTPSIGERALIEEFRAVLHRQLIHQLPEVLKREFTDFHAGLESQRGVLENFILKMLIPAIEKTIDQHPVAEAPPAEAPPPAWVRPFIAEETYEQALRGQNSKLALEKKRANALKAVFKNQIARRMERVLLTSGMPIHRTAEDVDDFDDDALCYADSWAGELAASAQDEKFDAEQAITALVDTYKRTYAGHLPADSTKLISSLVTAFSSAEQRVQERHSLRSRDVTGFLAGPDAQRLENIGIAEPYTQLQPPLLPSIFPYEPTEDERLNFGVPSFSVAATIRQPLEDQVPGGVLEQLKANGMSVDNLEIFFCVQNMPWNNSAFLLRPHPWLKPDAPVNQADYNHSSNIQVSVSDIGIRFPQLGAIDNVRVYATRAEHATRAGNVVYSGEPQFRVEGVQNFNNTHCFYSLCVDGTTNPKRAALTLHWLLNDADHAQISPLLPNTLTLEAFSKKVEALGQEFTLNKPINGMSPVKALNVMLQGGQPQAQPSEDQQYRLFGQPVNQVAPMAAARPVFHLPAWEEDEKLPQEVAARIAEQQAERARRGEAQPVMHFGLAARQPQPVAVPAVNAAAQAAEAQRVRLELQRQEAVRQAEARRVEEARLAEAERQRQAAARVAAPAPVRGGRSRG